MQSFFSSKTMCFKNIRQVFVFFLLYSSSFSTLTVRANCPNFNSHLFDVTFCSFESANVQYFSVSAPLQRLFIYAFEHAIQSDFRLYNDEQSSGETSQWDRMYSSPMTFLVHFLYSLELLLFYCSNMNFWNLTFSIMPKDFLFKSSWDELKKL